MLRGVFVEAVVFVILFIFVLFLVYIFIDTLCGSVPNVCTHPAVRSGIQLLLTIMLLFAVGAAIYFVVVAIMGWCRS